MIQVGKYNHLAVIREKANGVYLEGIEEGLLLPRRFVPPGTKSGDMLRVFIYHDSEGRLIATTQNPYGIAGEIRMLEVVSVTGIGAFLNLGLMKDLFIPKANMRHFMRVGAKYLVKIVIDEKTGRLSATEYFENDLSNEDISVKELEQVELIIYRKTDIGYEVIINSLHRGILHFSDIFRPVEPGDLMDGFVKKIFQHEKTGETLIDVAVGTKGYARVDEESEKILQLLEDHDGYLPYYDKSDPEDIYSFFKMSKKTFKMAIGRLYKEGRIELGKTGITLKR